MRFVLAAVTGIVLFGTDCAGAKAQNPTKSCDMACLQKKIEDLEQKLGALTTQVNNSIKSGQNITLHTQNGHPGGYRGLSRDQGGTVSWNANCSRDVLWTIN